MQLKYETTSNFEQSESAPMLACIDKLEPKIKEELEFHSKTQIENEIMCIQTFNKT